MKGTMSVPKAAKLIGCHAQTIRDGIDNGTFTFGFKFKGKKEWIYKVAEKPLMNWLGSVGGEEVK